jgi:hypothetical protein
MQGLRDRDTNASTSPGIASPPARTVPPEPGVSRYDDAMPTPITHLLYLHGFRSSPQSLKAQKVAARVHARHPGVTWWCPQLPPSPQHAMALVMQGIAAWPRASMAVMGSSLGGFYATWVAQQTGCPAVLLNPAVDPARDLAAYIGEQTAFHDPQERFFFEPAFVFAGTIRPMFLLFEEAGKVHGRSGAVAGRASAQVELDSGKRVKVKAANMLLTFEKPAPAELLRRPGGEREASSWTWPGNSRPRRNSALPTWRATISAPRPRWSSRLAPCSACSRRRITSAVPARGGSARPRPRCWRRRWRRSRRRSWCSSRSTPGSPNSPPARCPEPVREQLYKISVQAGQERARIQGGGRGLARHPPGAAGPAAEGRRDRFALPVPLAALPVRATFPRAPVSCHRGAADQGRTAAGRRCRPSRSTTRPPPRSTMRSACRAWAAAPSPSASTSRRRAWPWRPAARSTSSAAARLSTVYMPGYKITMLPDAVVQAYTLQEGRDCPAVSLYVTLDEATLAIAHSETRLERCRSWPTCATTSSMPWSRALAGEHPA